jgi:hypothetical protein
LTTLIEIRMITKSAILTPMIVAITTLAMDRWLSSYWVIHTVPALVRLGMLPLVG